jgi:cytochrome c biogenesis protein CcmG/thiol:disulfide interchange protein DsbE
MISVVSVGIFLKRNIFNLLLGATALLFFIQKMPTIIQMYRAEGQQVAQAFVTELNGQVVSIPLPQKHVLIFWATWCAPCKVELARINRLIINGELNPEFVLAVSVGEDMDLVSSFSKGQDYRFRVAVDKTREAAKLFQIVGTPTIVFVSQDQKIDWMTTGLSPTLEFRIRSFFETEM